MVDGGWWMDDREISGNPCIRKMLQFALRARPSTINDSPQPDKKFILPIKPFLTKTI